MTSIDFGEITPGDMLTSEVIIDPVRVDAFITAKILESSTIFKVVRIQAFDKVLQDADPNDFPILTPKPGHPIPKLPQIVVLEPNGQSNGVTPLAIKQGQLVAIDVSASAPSDANSTDVFTDTLFVEASLQDSLRVPLSMTLSHTIITFDHPLMIQPGQSVTLPITVRRASGGAKDIRVTLSPNHTPGISMPDTDVGHIGKGQTRNASLQFTAIKGADLGESNLAVEVVGEVGSRFFLPLNIVRGAVSVRLGTPADVNTEQGDSFLMEIVISLQGEATQVVLTPLTLPQGVSLLPQTIAVEAVSTFFAGLQITVDRKAPAVQKSPLTMKWSAYDGEQTGTISVNLTIEDISEATFSLEHPLSQISQENHAKLLVCDQVKVKCRNDGSWVFTAHLRNDEDLADASFLLEAKLNFVDAAGVQFGETIDGALSAAGEGPSSKVGLRILGYPPAGTFIRRGVFAAFENPRYWENVRSTQAQFKMLATFGEPDGANIPDPPDVPDPPDKKQ